MSSEPTLIMPTIDEVEAQARELPPEDRKELGLRLLRRDDDAPFNDEWLEEARRRMKEIDEGRMELLSIDDLRRYLDAE